MVDGTTKPFTRSDSHTCNQKEGNNWGGEVITLSDNETVLLENQQIADETEEEAQPQDWNEVIKEMDAQIEQLGWTKEQARSYVQVTYGKKSRLKLTDAELLKFLHHLQGLVKARE